MTEVTLDRAGAAEAELISNLMELYIHDLSAIFAQVKLGADGRFGYPELPSYLSGSSERCGFVIRSDESVAGFALVRRGSPVSDDPKALDVAEFFVLRQFRGLGVGRSAARQLWERMPGNWTVRASRKNPDAVGFWRSAVAQLPNERVREEERSLGSAIWVVFYLDAA